MALQAETFDTLPRVVREPLDALVAVSSGLSAMRDSLRIGPVNTLHPGLILVHFSTPLRVRRPGR